MITMSSAEMHELPVCSSEPRSIALVMEELLHRYGLDQSARRQPVELIAFPVHKPGRVLAAASA
jgi:hypothetical protein